MITPPQWITNSNLGSYAQSYSFYINPILLTWTAQSTTSVGLLNGSLPDGMYWVKTGFSEISLFGESSALDADISAEFTFRLQDQNGLIADQTFFITIQALIPPPSWQDQDTFLGYQTLGTNQSFVLTATTTSNFPIVYSLIGAQAGQSIDATTGVLSLTPAAALLGPPINVTVRATTGPSHRDIVVQYQAVRASDPPYFITKPGEVVVTGPGEYVEYLFRGYSPNGSNLTFTGAVPANYVLSSHGLLQGFAPQSNGVQTFNITITNVYGSRTQSQQITISNAINYQIQFRNTTSYLGNLQAGKFYQFDLGATSTYSNSISYSVSGGWLPPNWNLTPDLGVLQGFLDYVVVPRQFHWEISATDGVNTVTQEYYIDAYSLYLSQSAEFLLPVTGQLRTQLQDQTLQNYVTTTDFSDPALSIIAGIKYNNNISELLQPAEKWLTSQSFILGNLQVVGNTLWRNVYDHQLGANAVVTGQSGGTMYPQSLENLRRAWSQLGFISDGDGTGAILQPDIDLEIGSIAAVNVYVSGSSYRYPPDIVIRGTGNGAVLQSQLGVVQAIVESSSNGWSVGNTIIFETGVHNQPANLVVSGVNVNNYITSLDIQQPGLYSQTPIGHKVYQESDRQVTILAQWGIAQVDVLAAGSGYNADTRLYVTGTEQLPDDQESWQPQIHIASVDPLAPQGTQDNLPQRVWATNHLVIRTQGLAWQGSTSYDNQTTSWDGGSCTFQDWIQPSYTIWDQDHTTWDNELTTWDHQIAAGSTYYKFLQLDLDSLSWQQVYDALYSSDYADYRSDTQVDWLVNMPTFSLNAHNAIYTGNIAVV